MTGSLASSTEFQHELKMLEIECFHDPGRRAVLNELGVTLSLWLSSKPSLCAFAAAAPSSIAQLASSSIQDT